MSTPQVHTGEVGVDFIAEIVDEVGAVLDVSGTSAVEILFRNPSQASQSHTASLVTDGTDGKVHYITQAGNIDAPGIWSYQAKLTWPGGTVLYSTAIPFNVKDPLG